MVGIPGPIRHPYLLPAVAMMLGWGLRGFIGGGPLGAMIPGAMVMASICFVHPRRYDQILAAFAAIGVGFGGEMTYGQTVGFIVRAETFWWGFLGLALKGAIWGALGGAVITLGLKPMPRLVAAASAVMLAATAIGWKLVNQPKLIYFSHPTDKPREEIWAGFLLAAVALVAFLAWKGLGRIAVMLAAAGFVGGWIGFGFGGAIQGMGRIFTPELKLHWWKYMEFFFGFCFGWALAWAWYKTKPSLPYEGLEYESPDPPVWKEILSAAAVAALIFWIEAKLPIRFAYMVAGCLTLLAVAWRPWLARQVAYSVTFTAAAFDLARHWSEQPGTLYHGAASVMAALAGVLFAWRVRVLRFKLPQTLELLTWGCVGLATVKFAVNPAGIANLLDHVAIGFVLMAAAVSWMLRR